MVSSVLKAKNSLWTKFSYYNLLPNIVHLNLYLDTQYKHLHDMQLIDVEQPHMQGWCGLGLSDSDLGEPKSKPFYRVLNQPTQTPQHLK